MRRDRPAQNQQLHQAIRSRQGQLFADAIALNALDLTPEQRWPHWAAQQRLLDAGGITMVNWNHSFRLVKEVP